MILLCHVSVTAHTHTHTGVCVYTVVYTVYTVYCCGDSQKNAYISADTKKSLREKRPDFPEDPIKVIARKNVLARFVRGTKMSPQARSHNTQIIQRACSHMCS